MANLQDTVINKPTTMKDTVTVEKGIITLKDGRMTNPFIDSSATIYNDFTVISTDGCWLSATYITSDDFN